MKSIFEKLRKICQSRLSEEWWEKDILDAIKNYEEPSQKSHSEFMKEWNKNYKKDTTKNQRGEFETKKKQFPKSYKEVGNAYGEPDKNELETERAERRSVARHKKKIGVFESLGNLQVSEACFNDIVSIIEEYILELKDGTYRRMKDIAKALADEQEKILPTVKGEKNREFVKKDIIKRKRQALKAEQKYENQVVNRAKKEYEESKKKKN